MKIGMMMKGLGRYQDLARAVTQHGHDVVTLLKTEPWGNRDYEDMAAFMHAGYDLIHNTLGTAPLIFSRFVDTPLLTTIEAYPPDVDLPLYQNAPPRCYFVGTPETRGIAGVKFIFIHDAGADILADYLGVYELIRRETVREDRRPWGYYQVLADTPDHKVKRITVWPHSRLSLQSHKHRAEHWIIVSGTARVTVNDRLIDLGPSESVDIPHGAAHRIQNPGEVPLVFIEVQQGDYFGEDDITRLEDDFGRA